MHSPVLHITRIRQSTARLIRTRGSARSARLARVIPAHDASHPGPIPIIPARSRPHPSSPSPRGETLSGCQAVASTHPSRLADLGAMEQRAQLGRHNWLPVHNSSPQECTVLGGEDDNLHKSTVG